MALGVLHVDLDAFYASVEQLADPVLRGRPVVVGGLGPRGVVAAASYEARRFGIHSAMPMARARRACPGAAFLAPRFEAYRAASRQVMAILEAFTPLIEPLSLDEAFLDVRGVRRLHGTAPEIATAIRSRVAAETGLCASVGVASTKLLAKIASTKSKPDGLLVIESSDELAFLHGLAVQELWGVGAATRDRLGRLGIRTVGQLAATPEEVLVRECGVVHGSRLHALANNRDDRDVQPDREVKSVGHEQTFDVDLVERDALERCVIGLSDRVASRLRRAGIEARTVTLKVRFGDFRTVTRSRTLAAPSDVAGALARTAVELLHGIDVGQGIRLLGVTARQLAPAAPRQESLLDGTTEPSTAGQGGSLESQRAVADAVDQARRRFGEGAVFAARLAPSPASPPAPAPEGS